MTRLPAFRRQRLHRALRLTLAAGNLLFGMAAVLDAPRLARLVDEEEAVLRAIGRRDLDMAAALLLSDREVAPLVVCLLSDAAEAADWLGDRRMRAAVPLLWVGLTIAALLTAVRSSQADRRGIQPS